MNNLNINGVTIILLMALVLVSCDAKRFEIQAQEPVTVNFFLSVGECDNGESD